MEKQLDYHLRELKYRLKHVFIVFTVLTGVGFYFSGSILSWLQADLAVQLNALVAYEVIYTQIMISLLMGFFLSLPVFFYHLIKFMRPGLKDSEYRVLRNYLPFSIVLFIAGFTFAYQYIVKSSLQFFQASTTASGVNVVWGLQGTLAFALRLSAFTGVMFQLPIVAVVLARAGIIDRSMMLEYRRYFLVALLLLAAIATPPDIVTQIFLTLPVMGLYQLSIFLVGVYQTRE